MQKGDAVAADEAVEKAKEKEKTTQYRGADELHITMEKQGACVRRVPLDHTGLPNPKQARQLLAALSAPSSSPLGQLVSLLERVEDLSYVLLWSAKGNAGTGDLAVSLVELP